MTERVLIDREEAAKVLKRAAMLASPKGVIPVGDPEHDRLLRLFETLEKAAEAINTLPPYSTAPAPTCVIDPRRSSESQDWCSTHFRPMKLCAAAPAAQPLCAVHKSLEDRNALEVEISGMNCVACSLNERAELLKLLTPFAAPDGSKDSLQVVQGLIGALHDTLAEGEISTLLWLKSRGDIQEGKDTVDTAYEKDLMPSAFVRTRNVMKGLSTPAAAQPAGYQRRKCSVCGEGLGFSERDPCDKCEFEAAGFEIAPTTPILVDREKAAKVARALLPELKQERTSALCKAVTHKAILSRAEESIKQLLAALPPYTTAPARCVKCGHYGHLNKLGECQFFNLANSVGPCGCHCEFTTAPETERRCARCSNTLDRYCALCQNSDTCCCCKLANEAASEPDAVRAAAEEIKSRCDSLRWFPDSNALALIEQVILKHLVREK